MTIKQFIEKAIEGGWNGNIDGYSKTRAKAYIADGYLADVLLCADAWQAVGKVEGLNDTVCKHCGICWRRKEKCREYDTVGGVTKWHIFKMHQMIDALAEGKSIEEYIKTL